MKKLYFLLLVLMSLTWTDTTASAQEAYAALSDNNTVLTFYYDNNKTTRKGMSVGPFYNYDSRGWNDYFGSITNVVFDASFAEYRPTSTAYWFYRCETLTNIRGIENLKTDEVTDMRSMFHNCYGLTNLNVSNFNTSNVKDMGRLFSGCSGLTSLEVSKFNTSNVTNMNAMFYACSGLTSLNISNFNTSNVTNMFSMFAGCSGLTSLGVSNFNTSNVTDMGSMFEGCSGLKSLDVSKFNTINVKYMSAIFSKCSGLTSLDVSNFDTSNVTDMKGMFYGCSSFTNLDVSNFNTSNVTHMGGMFNGCSSLMSLDLSSFNTSNVTHMGFMFYACSGLTSLNISNFKTSNVTNMGGMFYGCSKLRELNLNGFKTVKVKDMSLMFSYCPQLNSIIVNSDNWDVSNVTSSERMFSGCTSLVGGMGTKHDENNVDVSYAHIDGGVSNPGYLTDVNAPKEPEAYAALGEDNTILTFYYDSSKESRNGMSVGPFYKYASNRGWNDYVGSITNVVFDASFAEYRPTSTAYWFYRCETLTNIRGIENLKTDEVTDMEVMFYFCHGLTSLDLSSFNTTNVTNMRSMFYGCGRLTSLDVSNFNTSNVTNMHGMFYNCSGLTNLDVSNFNTEKVTRMDWMFRSCSNLTSLDVSNFNTGKVTDMSYMFSSCSKLNSINVNSSNWDVSNVTISDAMFTGCTSLVGGMGTKYNVNHVDISYAHIDGGVSNPGYFTYKSDTPEEIEETIPSDGGNGQTSGAYTVLNDGTLTFYYDNDRSSKTGTVYDIYTSYTGYPDWAKDSLNITKAVFDVSFANFKPTSTAYWFSCCPMMTEIEGLGRLDTRNVTDMRYMFHNCRSLNRLDTGDFLTSHVTDMSNMFSGCHELSNVDVTCFNTSNVTAMEAMFMDCRSLSEIDVTGFETKNVSTMANMFRGCNSLSEINLKNMSIASLTNTYAMFYGCEDLTTIYSNTDWSMGSITSSDFMFGLCLKIKGGNGTLFNSKNTDKAYALPDGSNSRLGYYTMRNGGGTPSGNVGTNGAPVYAVLNNGTLTFYCDNLWSSRSGTRYDIDDLKYSYSDQLRSYRTMPEWIEDRNLINRAVFDPSFANYKPKSTVCWFYSCQHLTTIEGMEYLNTSEVTNMSAMFRFCYSLTDVDVSYMDTRNVTDMSFVFCYCVSLNHIDVSKFNTENVINMEHMFHTCPVDTLDLSNFETSKVTDMNTMFDYCKSLKTIYAKMDKWNTDNVIHSSWMFTGCNSLVGGQGTKFDSNHTDKEYAVIDGGMCVPGYLTDDENLGLSEAYVVRNNETMTFYYDCFKNCREGEIYMVGFKENTTHNGCRVPIWCDLFQSDNITKKVFFDPSFADYSPVSTSSWFAYMGELISVEGIENLNTSETTEMGSMFCGCSKLVSLNLNSLDTRNVTTMSYMFYDCYKLATLNIEMFNTANVTDMNHMFSGCSSLMSLDLSGFKTDKVTDMRSMFWHCSSLKSLDLSNFKTDNVTNMYGMFERCSNLTTLDVSNFKTDKVTDMSDMFYDCFSLASLDVSNFSTDNVTNMSGMFYNCRSLTSLDVSGFKTDKVTDMSIMFYDCHSLTSLYLSGFNTDKVKSMISMFYNCHSLTILDLSGFKTDNVTNMYEMFYNCRSLASLDVSGFKTDNVTNMYEMFYNCRSLASLDVSGFKTDNVTNMSRIFYGCSNLTTLDVSDFKTDKVTDMSDMFWDCSGLTSLDVSGFNTDNVTSMGGMFYNCRSLTSLDVNGFKTDNVTSMTSMFSFCSGLASLDVSGFKTDNVTYMGGMFSGCRSLTSLDVNGFNTDNVTSMGGMFSGCRSLTSLDVNGFNTDNVTSMSSMFSGCSGLTSLDLSNFKTDNVTNMYGMFERCSNLTSLDLSGFKTDKVTDMSYMFYDCSGLTTIYADEAKWSTVNVYRNYYMFTGCTNIIGGNGTKFDRYHTGAEYARIDGGAETPGYFTYKTAPKDNVTLAARNYTREYGEENPKFEYEVTEGTITSGTPEITCEATTTSSVGTYDIVVSKGSVSNNEVGLTNGTLTITKAPLTIKAKSYTIVQGEEFPDFEAEYEGFKNGETYRVLTKRPIMTTTAYSTNEPSTYDIIASSAEAENYEISYVWGKLTVTPKPLPEITPIEGEISVNTEGLSEADLTDNVVNDVYYNVGEQGYDAAEKSIVISEATNMAQITDKEPGSKDVKESFNGIILKVGKGFGLITVSAKTSGNAQLVVQVGESGMPMIASRTEKGDVVVSYDVSEDTYVYIYAIKGSSAAKLVNGDVKDNESDIVRIYGITVSPGATGVRNVNANGNGNDDAYYTLDGKKLDTAPKKGGIYVRKGRLSIKR